MLGCYYNEYLDINLDDDGYYKPLLVFYIEYKNREYPYFLYLKKKEDKTFEFKVVNYEKYVLDKQMKVESEELTEILTKPVNKIKLTMGAKILIPSGIHVNLPDQVFLVAENKSGIASKRGLTVGACVTGETLIETNKGKFKASDLTKDFCTRNNILIKSYNSINNSYEFKKCDGFRCTGKKDCIKVTFDDGSEIIGSYDHCIYENNKWCSLEYL